MLRNTAPKRPESLADLIDSKTIARLGQLDVSSRKIFSGKLQGERRSKRRGESVEFADHRPYTMGDDLRHIDWNILGRLDKLFMKVFLEDEDLSLHLVLDASASADCGDPAKFWFMQQATAAMAYIGLVNLNRLTLTALGERSPDEGDDTAATTVGGTGISGVSSMLRNLRGRRRLADVERWLCSLEPRGATSFQDSCRQIALARSGKGVMIIFSDFLFKEGYEQGLRYLAGRGFDVVCVQVLSPQELDPTITGDLRLRDAEDGDRAEITVSGPLLKRYRATLAAYCDELRQFCGSRDMMHIAVPSDTPIETLLLDHLRRRGVLR